MNQKNGSPREISPELLKRYVEGQCTPEEAFQVDRTIKDLGQMLEGNRIDVAAEDMLFRIGLAELRQTRPSRLKKSTAAEAGLQHIVGWRLDRPARQDLAQRLRSIVGT